MFPMYGGSSKRLADVLLNSNEHKIELINQLILYDQVWIPTSNLMVIPVLRLWLGESYFDLLIRENVIVLFRHDNWFGYVGNGGGLSFYQIRRGKSDQKINLGTAGFLPLEESLPFILTITRPESSSERRNELESLLSEKIIELPVAKFADQLRNETYTDVLKSPILLPFFNLRHDIGSSLDKLKGIQSNQMKCCDPHSNSRDTNAIEIETLIEIAFRNFILHIGTELGVTDIQADKETFNVFWAKGQRFGFDKERLDSFSTILEVEGVPSIGTAFAKGSIGIKEVIKIRDLNSSRVFRDWLGEAQIENKVEVVRQYIDSIKQPTWLESVPAKILRMGVQVVGSSVGSLFGDPYITPSVLAATDSFLLQKWAKRNSPSLFINDLKNIVLAHEDAQKGYPNVIPGKLRNAPCPCGSGKKLKRCCGK